MIGPIMEELTAENAGKKIQIVKINVDENSELSTTFNISSIPVVFFIKNGKNE
jgi:thioredoxin 1